MRLRLVQLLQRKRKLISLGGNSLAGLIEVEPELDAAADAPDHRAEEHGHEETAEGRAALQGIIELVDRQRNRRDVGDGPGGEQRRFVMRQREDSEDPPRRPDMERRLGSFDVE